MSDSVVFDGAGGLEDGAEQFETLLFEVEPSVQLGPPDVDADRAVIDRFDDVERLGHVFDLAHALHLPDEGGEDLDGLRLFVRVVREEVDLLDWWEFFCR